MKPELSIDYVLGKMKEIRVASEFPLSPEYFYKLLLADIYSKSKPTSRNVVKLREYTRVFTQKCIDEGYVAGGVIYPNKVSTVESQKLSGLSLVWQWTVKKVYDNGFTYGQRRSLSNIAVTASDIRLGQWHYHSVGYSDSRLTKVWSDYFNDFEIEDIAKNLEIRTGYNVMYRCKPAAESEDDNACIDSITLTVIKAKDIRVHVNFRTTNVNRMGLMDWYLIHRFIRLVVPLKNLPYVRVSAFFACASIDLLSSGWMCNIPELRFIAKKHSPKNGSTYKAVQLAADFKGKGREKNFGVNTFINCMYGLEGLNEHEFSSRITEL